MTFNELIAIRCNSIGRSFTAKNKLQTGHTPIIGGIYKITHIETGNFYIGCSRNIIERVKSHQYSSNRKSLISQDLLKYGVDQFDFKILFDFSIHKIENNTHYKNNVYFEQLVIKLMNPYYNKLIYNV